MQRAVGLCFCMFSGPTAGLIYGKRSANSLSGFIVGGYHSWRNPSTWFDSDLSKLGLDDLEWLN